MIFGYKAWERCLCAYLRGEGGIFAWLQWSSLMMLWGRCVRMDWQGEDACLWLTHPSGKFLLVSASFTHCQSQPDPNHFIPLSCDQTSCRSSLWKEVDLIQSDSGSWSPSWNHLFYFLFVKERKAKNKTQENILSLLPSPSALPLISLSYSFFFSLSLCGNRAVCSVGPHWLNISMGKWTLAFSLFPAPLPRLRPSVNVRTHVSVLTQSAVTVLFFWESGTLIASLWCKPKAKEVAVLTLNRSAKARSFWVAVIWIRAVVSSSIVFAGENQLISQSVQHTHTHLSNLSLTY